MGFTGNFDLYGARARASRAGWCWYRQLSRAQSTVDSRAFSNFQLADTTRTRNAQSAKRKLLAFCILRAQEFQGESDSTRNGDRGPGGLFALPCALCLAPSTCTPIFDHVFDVPRVSFARACPPREASFSALERKIPNSPSKLPESLHAVSGLPPQLKTHKSESSKRLKGPI